MTKQAKRLYDGMNGWQKSIFYAVVIGILSWTGHYIASGAMKAHETVPRLERTNENVDNNSESIRRVYKKVDGIKDEVGKVRTDVTVVRAILERMEKHERGKK